jgi:hypothetical protein
MPIDPRIREFATERQREIIDAVVAHGSQRKAAKALGITHGTVGRRIVDAEKRAARAGYSPAHDLIRPAPDGVKFAGTSTYYRATDETPAQWVLFRAEKDQERYQKLHDAFVAATEEIPSKKSLVKPPRDPAEDLMCVIPIGDPHVGMYSWAQETGDNYDLDHAERLMYGGVDYLLACAPEAKTGVIINLGDFFHADNVDNRTARSGHSLDVDSRWGKVLQVGYGIMIRCIDRALERFETVHVFNEIGNHDDHSAVQLALYLSAWYRNEPRVIIDVEAAVRRRHYIQFGKVLIGATHGNDCSPERIALAMQAEQAPRWGESLYRHWYVGHIHKIRTHETGGLTIEYCRTLAAKDAWAASQAYNSQRDMRLHTWHRERGFTGTNAVNALSLGAMAA